jgi:HK97 family phage prohead protease
MTVQLDFDAINAKLDEIERPYRFRRAWRKFLADAGKLTARYRKKLQQRRKVYHIPPRTRMLPRKSACGIVTKEMQLPTTYQIEQSSRTIRCIISTSDVDRVGDIVVAEGCDTTNYERCPTVLLNHDHDKIIGKCTALKIGKGKITATLELTEGVEDADRALRLIRAGALNAISIGFDPTEEPERIVSDTGRVGLRFNSWELLEISIVAVPANPNALIL